MHACMYFYKLWFCVNFFELGFFPETVRENLDLLGIPDEGLVIKSE